MKSIFAYFLTLQTLNIHFMDACTDETKKRVLERLNQTIVEEPGFKNVKNKHLGSIL